MSGIDDQIARLLASVPAEGWPTIVLSAHFDDGILSVAGYLSRVGGRALVITVHGGEPASDAAISGWDELCGFTSGVDAARWRADEDRAACLAIGVDSMHLPYPDGPYFDQDAGLIGFDVFLNGIVRSGTQVLIPAGVGGHADHIRARNVALPVLAGLDHAQVKLYADLPYASKHQPWEKTAEATTLPQETWDKDSPLGPTGEWVMERVDLTQEEWIGKRAAVFAHASQLALLGHSFAQFTSASGPLTHELLWSRGA